MWLFVWFMYTLVAGAAAKSKDRGCEACEQAQRSANAAATAKAHREAAAAAAAHRKTEETARATTDAERLARLQARALVAELIGEQFTRSEAEAAVLAAGPDNVAARNFVANTREVAAAERVMQQRRRAAERVPPNELIERRLEIDGKGAGVVISCKKGVPVST